MSPIEQHLLSHSRALRSLARALVGEQHVDDLLQDTALQALTGPPARQGSLGGWFVQVLRHLASKHRRTERRRRARELAAAHDRVQPAADDELGTAETFRRLNEAVLALPAIYREVVLRRYLRDQGPSLIAAEMGVPLATVKSRLQRGLDLLRERLDHDGIGGDWRLGVVTAFGLEPAPPAVAATLVGATLMSIGTKWALVGIAAALATLVLWPSTPEWAPPAPVTTVAATPEAAGASVQTEMTPTTAPTERRAVASEVLAQPATTTIRGRCVDEFGQPLAKCRVTLNGMPNEQDQLAHWVRHNYDPQWQNPPAQTTAADGRFEWQFVPHEPLRFLIAMEQPGRVEMRCEWESRLRGKGLALASVVELGDVALRPGALLRGRVVDVAGQPVQTRVYAYWARAATTDGVAYPLGSASIDSDAAGTFEATAILPFGVCQLSVYERKFHDGAKARSYQLDSASPWVELVVQQPVPRPSIRGVVVDEQGAPVQEAVVSCIHGNDYTDHQGRFAFTQPSPKWPAVTDLTATAVDCETTVLTESVAWGTQDLRLVLRPAVACELRVVDPLGRPVDEFAAWIYQADQSPDRVTAAWRTVGLHSGGSVRVPLKTRGPHRLLVEPRRRDLEMTLLTTVSIDGPGPVHLDVQLPQRAERIVRVQDRAGKPVVNTTVELLEAERGEPEVTTKVQPLEEFFEGRTMSGKVLARQTVSTDAAGEARLHGPAGGMFCVRVPGPHNLPLLVRTVSLDAPEPLVVTVDRGAALRIQLTPPGIGTVLAAYGTRYGFHDRTLPRLWLHRKPVIWDPQESRCVATITPDDVAEFPGVEAGTWHVAVTFLLALAKDHGQQSLEYRGSLELRDGAVTNHTIDLSHLLPAQLECTVLNNGAPFANTTVRLTGDFGDTGGGYRASSGFNVRTDENGRCRLTIRPGSYTVDWPFAADERVVVSPGVQWMQTFSLHGGTVRVTLRQADGKTAAGYRLWLKSGPWGMLQPSTTDAHGRADLLASPGTHDLMWQSSEAATEPTPLGTVTILPGATVDVERTLPSARH